MKVRYVFCYDGTINVLVIFSCGGGSFFYSMLGLCRLFYNYNKVKV